MEKAQNTSVSGSFRHLSPLFQLAKPYIAARHGPTHLLRESQSGLNFFPYSERHLQCAWLDKRLRPAQLRTAEGEILHVIDPGTWNHEAGPDFLNAVFEVGPYQRRVSGDAEIHIRPNGWKDHGHHNDPNFNRVRCHVTYFPGQVQPGLLPPGTLEVSLKEALDANSWFSFEAIDLEAYPYAMPFESPIQDILSRWPLEKKQGLLESAGAETTTKKKKSACGFSIGAVGADQVLYEETFVALGYAHNQHALRSLAQRLPLQLITEASGNNAFKAYAIYLGVAGLLRGNMPKGTDGETKNYIRRLWDLWWPEKDRFSEIIMSPFCMENEPHPARQPTRKKTACWSGSLYS